MHRFDTCKYHILIERTLMLHCGRGVGLAVIVKEGGGVWVSCGVGVSKGGDVGLEVGYGKIIQPGAMEVLQVFPGGKPGDV